MDNRPNGPGSAAPTDPAQDAAPEVPDEWVTNLVKGFAQTLRARQIYSPSNPTYQRFLNSLRSGLSDLWSKTDELTLELEEEAMLWRGATVYRGEDKADSLAFLFFKDGVRELTFLRGFEKDELERFVEVLNRVRHLRPTDEDDLLTLLWNANFSRVQYASVDLFAEGLDIPEPTAQPLPAPSRVIQEELPTEGEGGAAVETAGKDLRELTAISVEDFDPTLYFLDAAELDRLRDEVGGEL
ncbi:MAG: hypothetical protein HY701_01780, partial [Gemmatimonadetes bacterium]|nr:hypothetical protein [Gemmatimonadota bacterium]